MGRAERSMCLAPVPVRMEAPAARPVQDRAALELVPHGTRSGRGWIVVADLHLGLGSFSPKLPPPPSATPEALARSLLETARIRRAKGIIFAGDVKHPIVGTPSILRRPVFDFFSTLLSDGLRVELIPGNHDGGIVPFLPREVVVHPASGAVHGTVGMFHGHCWPSDRVLSAPTLVVGHLHPGFRFAPTAGHPGGKERCWLRVRFPPAARDLRRGRNRSGSIRARELIVLPAFNPLTGTEALNREAPARVRSFLYRRFVAGGRARAYLLDGTDLGDVRSHCPRLSRASGASEARRGR